MLVFISSPYSPTDPKVKGDVSLSEKLRQHRYEKAEAYCAKLYMQGIHALSPIVNNHYLAKHQSVPADFNFWQSYCYKLIDASTEVHVLCLHGWDRSEGVLAEIAYADKLGKPVIFVKDIN